MSYELAISYADDEIAEVLHKQRNSIYACLVELSDEYSLLPGTLRQVAGISEPYDQYLIWKWLIKIT